MPLRLRASDVAWLELGSICHEKKRSVHGIVHVQRARRGLPGAVNIGRYAAAGTICGGAHG